MIQGSNAEPLDFRSDNVASVAPEIMAALAAANSGTATSYGKDDLSAALDRRFTQLFGREARVFPVATGTAANALSLAAITPPYGAIYCHETAHVHTSEAGATEFYSGGAKLMTLPGPDFKLRPETVERAIRNSGLGQTHKAQPAGIAVTQATDYGTVYGVEELAALGKVARANGLKLHMDGARLANALAHLGAAPADVTWRIGVDILSFGATKNGAMNAEAIVVFDPALARDLAFRLRRAGQVWSKMRFAAAQLIAYVEDGLWLRCAARANALAARLAAGVADLPGIRFLAPVEANEVFLIVDPAAVPRLEADGLMFHRRGDDVIRLVCRFDGTEAEVDGAISCLRRRLDAALTPA